MKGKFAKCLKCNAKKIISLTASIALAFLGITLMSGSNRVSKIEK